MQERTAELMRINEELRREIAEHQQSEKALRESEERYRALYEEAPNAYLSLEADLRITQCNPAAEQFLGYTCAELGQMTLLDLFAEVPEGRPRAEEVFQRVLSGTTIRDQELQMQKKDQTLVWISLRMSLVKGGQEQGMEYRALVVDITERKRRELAIKAERNHLHQENIALRVTLQDRYKFGAIIGKSPAMQTVYESIVKASASDANVVLCGESGTGKELVAKTIHQLSARRTYAFAAVNCGAVLETLFEREFFGHRKGSFTGADRNKAGYLDHAHKGTLFLDEISELSQAMQVKLLRVLQEGEYTPIGQTASKTADVRIIAATNKDLKTLLHQGKIREDFYYRIRVMVIKLPPLRERKEDLPLLVEHFLKIYRSQEDYPAFPEPIMQALYNYNWPGNIRELQNELQRYVTEGRLECLAEQSTIDDANLLPDRLPPGLSFREAVEAYEQRLLLRALTQHNWHQGKTAEMLGIPPRTLYEKIKKYNLKHEH